MILDNPSIRKLLTHFGTAFSIYKVVHDSDTGKTDTVLNAEQVRAELGENLTDARLKYFNSLKNVTEFQYRRQKEVDNGLATVNEEQYKEQYRAGPQSLVDAYENLVQVHEASFQISDKQKVQ